MKRPQMILFDYGHTLTYGTHVDYVLGAKAVLSHATENPKSITAEQLQQMGESLFEELKLVLRPNSIEVDWLKAEVLLYDKLGFKQENRPTLLRRPVKVKR